MHSYEIFTKPQCFILTVKTASALVPRPCLSAADCIVLCNTWIYGPFRQQATLTLTYLRLSTLLTIEFNCKTEYSWIQYVLIWLDCEVKHINFWIFYLNGINNSQVWWLLCWCSIMWLWGTWWLCKSRLEDIRGCSQAVDTLTNWTYFVSSP